MATYLDCGCYIDDDGHRTFCPTCLQQSYMHTPKGRLVKHIENAIRELNHTRNGVADLYGRHTVSAERTTHLVRLAESILRDFLR